MNMLRPIRVLLMAGSMELGGSEQQTCLLLNHLDRTQFQPHLYLTYRRGQLLDRVPGDVPIESFDDLKFSPRWNWPGRWHKRMVRHLRDLLRRWQIDVVYDRSFHMTIIAGPACGRRIGRVSTIVCPPAEELPRTERRFLEIKRRKLAGAYRQAARVVAVSEAVKQSAVAYYGLSSTQIATVRSPVDTVGLKRAAGDNPPDWFPCRGPRDSSDQESPKTNVICVARMTAEKGHDTLLSAVKLLIDRECHTNPEFAPQNMPAELPGSCLPGSCAPDQSSFKFWLVGDGPLRKDLERQAVQLGIAEHVSFTGVVASVAPLVARCDVLVCPSRYEGLPNVILEAMALGVPVIASSVGGIPEVVQVKSTGTLVPAGDPQRLADALWDFRQEPRPFREMAVAGSTLVERQYSLSAYLDTLGGYFRDAFTLR